MTHTQPSQHRAGAFALLFGTSAAPLFWLGQMMLGYTVSALACYGSDHPTTIAAPGMLRATLIAFDVVAFAAAFAGAAISYANWRRGGDPAAADTPERVAGDSRVHFLALWGLLSSLWFFAAILFNAIASITVPLCVR
ncbi:MAG TPA: hypothetical protein VMH86_14530 [Rhizomicrobium sp.]|nr:hypothetical protein [Rhizomicrobium sp.]